MQAFADRAALSETLQTGCDGCDSYAQFNASYTRACSRAHLQEEGRPEGCCRPHRLATFFSRSRGGRWCKGETSGNYIHVKVNIT